MTRYAIEQKKAGGRFQQIGIVDSVTTFPVTGLDATTEYSHKVRALASPNSDYSNTVTDTTNSALFDPSDLTEAIQWYDPGLVDWKTGNAQDFITFNGADVSQLDDRGGTSNHITQPSPGDQPTTTTSFFGGNRALEFDVSNSEYLESINNVGITGSANRSVFVVARWATSGLGYAVAWGSNSAGRRWSLLQQSGDMTGFFNTGQILASAHTVTNEEMWGLYLNGTTTNDTEIFLDGDDQNGTISSGGTAINTTDSHLFVGTSEQVIQHINGQIVEIVVVDGFLSSGDNDKMFGYFAARHDLLGSLDAGHTYKVNPPAP